MTMQIYSVRTRVVALIMVIVFVSACASSTVISSRPPGAEVYMDNIKKGKTPLTYSDTAVAGTAKAIRLEKPGYKSLDTVIRKDKFEIGPCIGGILILFPFIWVLGYQEAYDFELEPEKTE